MKIHDLWFVRIDKYISAFGRTILSSSSGTRGTLDPEVRLSGHLKPEDEISLETLANIFLPINTV